MNTGKGKRAIFITFIAEKYFTNYKNAVII